MTDIDQGRWAALANWFKGVDGLLRGAFAPEDEAVDRPSASASVLLWLCIILGGSYGVFMGTYALLRGGDGAGWQVMASAVKVPLLFLLTLAVTFPSLYVFSALGRSQLTFTRSLKLMLVAITLNLAVLASFGPVTVFFSVSTTSYSFMIVLNVLFFAVSGTIGLKVLWRAVQDVFEGQETAASKRVAAERSRWVFTVWCAIYCAVGAQMGWLLRPFIGAPDLAFQMFRERDSSFFEAFMGVLRDLFGA